MTLKAVPYCVMLLKSRSTLNVPLADVSAICGMVDVAVSREPSARKFTVNGVDTLFLLAMLAAGGGALLIELDRDRPWPPPERSGG